MKKYIIFIVFHYLLLFVELCVREKLIIVAILNKTERLNIIFQVRWYGPYILLPLSFVKFFSDQDFCNNLSIKLLNKQHTRK